MPILDDKQVQPFVGREDELNRLAQALEAALAQNKPQYVLVEGDFGVGKTALVEQFLARVQANPPQPLLIGVGQCSMESEHNGLVPFSQLFGSLVQQGELQKVLAGAFSWVKEVAPAWVDVLTGGVGTAVKKTIEETRKVVGGQTFSQENVLMQFTQALGHLAEKRPLVAFVDDLQWADTLSLTLAFHLARNLENCPVLIIYAYRPSAGAEGNRNADLFRKIRAELIHYGKMRSENYGATELILTKGIDVVAYAAQRYPGHLFPQRLLKHVDERTEGHALFVSQLFTIWEETNVIAQAGEPGAALRRWVLAQPEATPAIPQSLSEVLEERVRLMEENLRDVLSYASVQGEEFTAQVVMQLCKLEECRVYDELDQLEHQYRLVLEQEGREADLQPVLDFYKFTHRFIRQWVYEKMPGGKRRHLHQKVAECLERLYPDRRPIAGDLSDHFAEARDFKKAAEYALMAARFEQARYLWTIAEERCNHGLAFLGKLPETEDVHAIRLELLYEAGRACHVTGKYTQADGHYRDALALMERLGADAGRQADVCQKLADVCEYENRYDEVWGFVARGRQLLADHAIPFDETHARLDWLWWLMQGRTGAVEQAANGLRQLLADIDRAPRTPALRSARARVENSLGVVCVDMGRYEEALSAFQGAVTLATAIGEKTAVSGYTLNMAETYLMSGRFELCERYIARGLELAKEMSVLDDQAHAQALAGQLSLARGRGQEAVYQLSEAITLAETAGSAWYESHMHASLALAYLAVSDHAAALREATYSVQMHDVKYAYCWELANALDALARVEAARGDAEAAAAHFRQAIAIHQEAGHRHFAARAQLHCADFLARCGDRGQALDTLRLALQTLRELAPTPELPEAEKLMQELEAGAGATRE